jgi:hypothetical protein
VLLLATLTGAFVAGLSPLIAAFQMSQAARAGDAQSLADRADWPAVRSSLKASLAELPPPAPTLWSRLKAAMVPVGMIDGMIDRHVTPDGIAAIGSRRVSLHGVLAAAGLAPPPPDPVADSLPVRVRAFWQRLHRVGYRDARHFEIEVADRSVPARRYHALLRRDGLTWRVTEFRIAGAGF